MEIALELTYMHLVSMSTAISREESMSLEEVSLSLEVASTLVGAWAMLKWPSSRTTLSR